MEVATVVFVLGMLLLHQERRQRAKDYAPAPCRDCEQWVFWDHQNNRWIHADGRQRAEWPDIRYDLPGPTPPLHTAAPYQSALS